MKGSLNFSRRPFVDERALLFGAVVALVFGAVLLFANVRQWSDFHSQIRGTAVQTESLQARRDRAVREAAESRAAIDSYRVSSLATQSQAILKLVGERRFSWIGLLGRLERTLPADVRVTRLQPGIDKGGVTITCSMVGRAHDSVANTITALSKDRAFEAVDLKSETNPEGGAGPGVEGYTFDLVVRYKPAEAAR